MVFSNLTFVCLFLPTVLACYFIAPRSARNIVLVSALATVSAFIYNVSADLAGGLEVTLSERE